MINCIAPAKKIQCNDKYAPWIDNEFIGQAKLRDQYHSNAKSTDSNDDWRLNRVQRNITNNLCK